MSGRETLHRESEVLRDDQGRKVDLLWFREATIDDVVARLGEPPDQRTLEQDGFEIELRDWWLWGGAVGLRRADAPGFVSPMVGLHAAYLPVFTLELAMRLSGLAIEDAPKDPECTPSGVVTWNGWSGVGRVRLNYVLQEVQIDPVVDPGGGGKLTEPQVIELARFRQRVA